MMTVGLLHDYHDDCWTVIITVTILVTIVIIIIIIMVVIIISFYECISSVALDSIGDAEDVCSHDYHHDCW